jgi:hypothetical protein
MARRRLHVVDVAHDRFLVRVVVHGVSADRPRVLSCRGFSGGVEQSVLWVGTQPIAEDPMPLSLCALRRVHVQVARWIGSTQTAVLIPPGLSDHERKAALLKRGHVSALVAGVGDREIDIDHGLGRQIGDRRGADMLDRNHRITERLGDFLSKRCVRCGPRGVRRGDFEIARRLLTGDPRALTGWWRSVVECHDFSCR